RGGLDWFTTILERAPGVRILATARERLGISLEWTIELEGLASPVGAHRDEFDRSEAVQLFLENVGRTHPGFSLREDDMPFIAEICRMLGGLPLALELASRRVRIMSCAQIAAEIESDLDFLHTEEAGIPERHRSMRAVFDRSWGSLSEQERRALRALALCKGSCPWDIAAAGIDAGHSVLESLAAKGLVHQPTPGRIKLHPMITYYAEGKLAGIPQEAHQVRRRFARAYARLAAEWEPGLKGGSQRATLEAFDAAIPNMSQCFLWAAEMQDEPLMEQYVPGLSLYYLARGRFHDAEEVFRSAAEMVGARDLPIPGEGGSRLAALLHAHHGRFLFRIGRFEEAAAALNASLARFREDRDRRGQAMALGELGHVARLTGCYEEAEVRHRDALELERASGTTWGIARCLQDLGNVACAQGRYTDAVRFHRESLALSRQLDDQIGAASCMNNLANALDSLGRAAEARHYYEQGVASTRTLGDTQLYALALANFGNIAYKQGDYAAAIPALEESLALERKTGSLEGQAFCLSVLGDIALAQGRQFDARDLLEQSLVIGRQTGDRSGTAYILNSLGSVALALGDSSEAAERCAESVGIFEDIGEQWGLALSLQGLADAQLARSNPEGALGALRQALALSSGLQADPLTADILLTWAVWYRAQGNVSRATELASHAATHPSTEVQTRDRAARVLSGLRAELPPEAYDAACAAGERASLETLIGSLLAPP
ncbi:MAG: tetratricopeptide repeat protein, partial [Candidatus Eisenbacteria bacterium]|nr:tetratricopeptide repeat protein [Candidatus Eisenbacteria bacterium]